MHIATRSRPTVGRPWDRRIFRRRYRPSDRPTVVGFRELTSANHLFLSNSQSGCSQGLLVHGRRSSIGRTPPHWCTPRHLYAGAEASPPHAPTPRAICPAKAPPPNGGIDMLLACAIDACQVGAEPFSGNLCR